MIQVKNQWINGNKIVSLSFAESEKNNKNYLIILLDVSVKENNKIFIEVQNENEFMAIMQQVKNQMQNA
jgi:hypothetical protein